MFAASRYALLHRTVQYGGVLRRLSNYDELGSLKRRRIEADVSLAELADELKRARQAVAVLEQRDLIAPDRVRPVSRERYLAALGAVLVRRAAERRAIAESLIAAGVAELAEVNA